MRTVCGVQGNSFFPCDIDTARNQQVFRKFINPRPPPAFSPPFYYLWYFVSLLGDTFMNKYEAFHYSVSYLNPRPPAVPYLDS